MENLNYDARVSKSPAKRTYDALKENSHLSDTPTKKKFDYVRNASQKLSPEVNISSSNSTHKVVEGFHPIATEKSSLEGGDTSSSQKSIEGLVVKHKKCALQMEAEKPVFLNCQQELRQNLRDQDPSSPNYLKAICRKLKEQANAVCNIINEYHGKIKKIDKFDVFDNNIIEFLEKNANHFEKFKDSDSLIDQEDLKALDTYQQEVYNLAKFGINFLEKSEGTKNVVASFIEQIEHVASQETGLVSEIQLSYSNPNVSFQKSRGRKHEKAAVAQDPCKRRPGMGGLTMREVWS